MSSIDSFVSPGRVSPEPARAADAQPQPMAGAGAARPFTVSIVSHGQRALCARLLADLAQHASDAVDKVVLTLNAPEEAPSGAGLPFSLEVLHNARPIGFGENHNRAFTHCRTAYFAVLNPDLRVLQNPFPALSRCLADPAVGVAAPVVREADGAIADFARPLVSPWEVLRRRFGVIAHPDLEAAPDWIAGMFLTFRHDVFAELRGFDPRYFLYCEDVDLCARARLRGLRLEIARDASVTHLAQRASRRSLGRMWVHVWSLLRLWSSPAYRSYRALLRSQPARQK
jgi:GT2 family glycosyltransferase